MTYIATITQKGQVTIPAEIRRFMGVGVGDQIAFSKSDKAVVVRPSKDFMQLKGTVKGKANAERVTDQIVLNYIRKNYVKQTSRP